MFGNFYGENGYSEFEWNHKMAAPAMPCRDTTCQAVPIRSDINAGTYSRLSEVTSLLEPPRWGCSAHETCAFELRYMSASVTLCNQDTHARTTHARTHTHNFPHFLKSSRNMKNCVLWHTRRDQGL